MRSLPIRGRHTVSQVAQILGVKKRTVLYEIHHGDLVAERDGGRLRIWSDELARYVRGMR